MIAKEHALLVALAVGCFGLAPAYGQAATFQSNAIVESAPQSDAPRLSVPTPVTETVLASAYGAPADYAVADGYVLQTQSAHRQTLLSTALIVLAERDSKNDLETLTEDLNIMCRLLDRTVAGAGLRSDRRDVFSQLMIRQVGHNWPDRLFGDASAWTECLYVEGHGPLFVMNVDFPLVEGPQAEAPSDPNGPADPVWAEVSRDLRAQPGSRPSQRGASVPPYNPVKVLALKKALSRALKHAGNIRGLAPDETITVMVKGRQVVRSPQPRLFRPEGDDTRPLTLLGVARGEMVRMSRLVMRVRMEDIKALSSGASSEADFNQRIRTVQN